MKPFFISGRVLESWRRAEEGKNLCCGGGR